MLCPPNVPLSRWRGFAAAPHRGAATSKTVPIGFSGVLGGNRYSLLGVSIVGWFGWLG